MGEGGGRVVKGERKEKDRRVRESKEGEKGKRVKEDVK